MSRRWSHGLLAVIGYTLSPLSWWNDLFVNVPLAYVISIPFSMLNQRLFLPSFVIAYWVTNVAGLLLLHAGVRGLAGRQQPGWRWGPSLAWSLLYTLVIVALARSGWLPSPASYLPAAR